MSTHYGDYAVGDTVIMVFDTFAAATGAPAAITNFAAADIQIYKDANVTQRASANGIAVNTSFDTLVGLQLVTIDLSDNTTAGFYAAGSEYSVAVSDVTIDGQTVRFWLGSFSIERTGNVLALLKAGTVTTVPDAASTRTAVGLASANLDTQLAAIDTETDKIASIKTITDALVNLTKTGAAIGRGTAAAGGSTTSIPTSAFLPAGAIADQMKGRVVLFDGDTTTTTLRGVAKAISAASNAANPTFTVDALPAVPAAGDTFSVL